MGKYFWNAKLQTAGHPTGIACYIRLLKTIVNKGASFWLNKQLSNTHVTYGWDKNTQKRENFPEIFLVLVHELLVKLFK